MDIHIARDGRQFGPYPLEEVQRQLTAGTLLPTDYAWTEGAAGWVPLASFPGLTAQPAGPATASGPAPLPVSMEYRYTPAPPTSGIAIASLVCGIVSFVGCPGVGTILAIIFGHVAQSTIRSSRGNVGGQGLAIAGLILGYLGLAMWGLVVLAMMAGLAIPFFSQVQVKTKETQSISHAKMISVACLAYANDHHGAFPNTLDELVPKYLPDRKTLVCPLSPKLAIGYDYFGGTTNDPPTKVLLMSKYANHLHQQNGVAERVVAHVDGSCALEYPPPDLTLPAQN